MFWGDKYCPFVLQFETCISKHTIIPANMDPAEDWKTTRMKLFMWEMVNLPSGSSYSTRWCPAVLFVGLKNSIYIYTTQ
jgi:hypothetical protein